MKTYTLQIILVIFLAILLFYALYVSHHYKSEKFAQGEGPKIILYHASWCGHCKQYENSGVFDATFMKVKEDPQLKDKVTFLKLDYDMNKDEANKHGINAFPSIIAVNASGEKIEDFNGDIYSSVKLIEFAKKITK